MAALTANATRSTRNTNGKTKHTYTVKTSSVIYYNALVEVTQLNAAQPSADGTTAQFAGLATDNSTGTFPVTGDGTKTVDVYTNLEAQFTLETITKGNVLAAV